jgi:hypothetical protein
VEVQPFADLMGRVQAIANYLSADSIDQLRRSADAVVEGRLVNTRDGRPGVIEIVVDVTRVFRGDLEPGRLVVAERIALDTQHNYRNALPRGARVVAFLHGEPGAWGFGIEGLWIDCPGGEPSLVGRTTPWAGAYTFDDLAEILASGREQVPTCAEVEAFTEIVRNTGIDHDYPASASPDDLFGSTDHDLIETFFV